MKRHALIISLCGLLGCALSSNASIDITVNGTEYDINTVTVGTYDSANGYYYFSVSSGSLTTALFDTLTSQPWYQASDGNSAANFTVAYIAAVQAADPSASSDGALQAADNTWFIKNAYYAPPLSSSTELQGIDDGYGGTTTTFFQTTPLNQPLILAEATVVAPVPEPTTILAGALLLLPFGASSLRILRNKCTA